MKHLIRLLVHYVVIFGGPGLLVLGILDSSFLFAPLGNDILVVALTARHRSVAMMLYYAAMSTIGSVLGCLLVDLVLRRAGEKGLEKHLPRRRLEYVKRRVNRSAAVALVVAALDHPVVPITITLRARMQASALATRAEGVVKSMTALNGARKFGVRAMALSFSTSLSVST